ncbi:Uncharacterised protein [Mycobacteroides abscessus subsp. massiliense]|nr:Uncharacterised protein [Mycobacteroides abscessus subsp. massiliense]
MCSGAVVFYTFFRFFTFFILWDDRIAGGSFCVAVLGRLNGFRFDCAVGAPNFNACVGLFGRAFFGYVGFAGV